MSEENARMRFSGLVELVEVEEAASLQREVLKQSVTDPTTGMIDMSILTMGQISLEQKRGQGGSDLFMALKPGR